MCVLAQDCLQLKEETKPSSSFTPFCPDFTLNTPASCDLLPPPQIKSLFCINSFIAGGMSLALMGTVASACLPHVCVCLFLRGPRGLPLLSEQ